MIRLSTFFAMGAMLCCLSGCLGVKSVPVSYYVLASPPESNAPASLTTPPRRGPRIGILPVTMPGYLQRTQMVVRQSGSVDIKVEDYHRWGEDLGLGIVRVVSSFLTHSLGPIGGVAIPLRTGAPVDARIQLEIRRFEGLPGGEVTLEAFWTLLKDGAPIREGYFLQQAQAANSFASLVEQQSALLGLLGATIAADITNAVK